MVQKDFYAHSKEDVPPGDNWHLLSDHSLSVAELSQKFGNKFDGGNWSYNV